jgi:uncharacterized protein YecA (UPF0149 family)
MSTCTKFWLGSLKGRYQLECLVVEGRIILKWSYESKVEVVDWLLELLEGSCKHDNESSG